MALQDIKSQSVTIIPLITFLVASICIGIIDANFALIPIITFLLIGIIFYFWRGTIAFGTADYIVVFAISFLITDDQSPFFILLCGAFGILLSIISKNRKIPFIPAILLTTLVIVALRWHEFVTFFLT